MCKKNKKECWLIEFNKEILDENLIESIESLENFYAISYSELSTHWNYKVYLSNNSKIKIQTLIAKSKGSKNFLSPDLQIKNISFHDWLGENYKSFQPIEFDCFVFYADHIKDNLKYKKNMIKLNSSDAFGSGSHPTTKGCILSLNLLKKKIKPLNMLDIGCGSGVLSIYGALTWKSIPVLGIDIDHLSIIRSQKNSNQNKLKNKIKFELTDHYRIFKYNNHKKFDIVVANIISSTLLYASKEISLNISKNGYLILSGILTKQVNKILSTYKNYKLTLDKKITIDGWTTIIMKRNGERYYGQECSISKH